MLNKLLPRLAVALALTPPIVGAAVFLSAAWAQVPPPVPALPDSERRTQYSISATTCACSVNFQLYGSGTDIDQWIEVWVAGVRYLSSDATFGWKLTSATGTLATIPRPITNAVLTFNAAQTGIVQILGAERPRRLAQFAENRGVAARDLNQAITDLVAVERELWDKTNDVTGRAILGPPGESINKPLPNAATRANGVFIFDSLGNPTTTPIGTAPLIIVGPTGVTAKTAVYSAVTGDCGKQITLAGSAFYTLTIGAPGGFALNCFIAVNNLDTTRGKTIAISGITTFILWPGQSFSLFNSGGTWTYVTPPPVRWKLTGNTTVNIATTGSDSNDCLGTGTGACATLQKAWDLAGANFDLNQFNLLLQLADGTYVGGLVTTHGMVGGLEGLNNVLVQGNCGTPANVSLTNGAPGDVIGLGASQIAGNVIFGITCLRMGQSFTGNAISMSGGARLYLNNIIFNSVDAASSLIRLTHGAILDAEGSALSTAAAGTSAAYAIDIRTSSVALMDGGTWTCQGATAFTSFIYEEGYGDLYSPATYSGCGGTTGHQYELHNSNLESFGGLASIPGTGVIVDRGAQAH